MSKFNLVMNEAKKATDRALLAEQERIKKRNEEIKLAALQADIAVDGRATRHIPKNQLDEVLRLPDAGWVPVTEAWFTPYTPKTLKGMIMDGEVEGRRFINPKRACIEWHVNAETWDK